MSRIILVTGGARSGKSKFAESIYKDMEDVVYLATAKVYDDEMKSRVEHHRESRPQKWKTHEGTYELNKAVCNFKHYLLDCLTVLTSNIMFDITQNYELIPDALQKKVEDKVMFEIETLINKVKSYDGDIVIVTNEVGCSIVPENHIGRVYRDIIGRVNQRTAGLCSEVYLVACGIPLKLK